MRSVMPPIQFSTLVNKSFTADNINCVDCLRWYISVLNCLVQFVSFVLGMFLHVRYSHILTGSSFSTPTHYS